MESLLKHAAFHYKWSIKTDGRVILLDEPLDQQIREQLQLLEAVDGQGLSFLEDGLLVSDMEEILANLIQKGGATLLVFPGKGSKYPRKLSQICQEFGGTNVFAKRLWQPGSDPIVTTGTILPNIFLITNIETVVVVDDVISSGLTLQKVREGNTWKFPRATWVGVSWVAQMPQSRAKSGVHGYERIMTVCMVSKSNGARVPLNSLSTLRQNREIAVSYAQRHFKDVDKFLSLLA